MTHMFLTYQKIRWFINYNLYHTVVLYNIRYLYHTVVEYIKHMVFILISNKVCITYRLFRVNEIFLNVLN